MDIKEFMALDYKNQLQVINRSGKLKSSVIANDYQFTLYRVKGFYVELKRSIKEFSFENILAFEDHDIPMLHK